MEVTLVDAVRLTEGSCDTGGFIPTTTDIFWVVSERALSTKGIWQGTSPSYKNPQTCIQDISDPLTCDLAVVFSSLWRGGE